MAKVTDKVPKIHQVEIVKHGTELIVPDAMSYDEAINQLKRRKDYEEQEVDVNEDIDYFVWDAALAFAKAIQQMFGFFNQEIVTLNTPIGEVKRPPQLIAVEVDYNKTVSVPWGKISIPTVEGDIQLSGGMKDSIPILRVRAVVKRKYETTIKKLIRMTRQILREESIYIGKAFSIEFPVDSDGDAQTPVIKFMDVDNIDESSVVFSKSLERSMAINIFSLIERTKECLRKGIPLKRGVLLSGPYGTGKTLVTHITAAKCKKNGWTFIHCKSADELSSCIEFAHKYQPVLIFCEDIDRVMEGERDLDMDEILNIVDGIESKNTQIMVVLTTNHVEKINAAMLRPGRLDAIINVTPPDQEAVERLLKLYGKDSIKKGEDLSLVSSRLEGKIPAIIRECIERAKLAAISQGHDLVTANDLLDAVDSMQNQLELLNKQSDKISDPARIGAMVGGAFIKAFKLEANGSKVTG